MSGVIQCSLLGKRGQFGSQLFQYAFTRAYAEHHGCCWQLPPWIGDRLFPNACRFDLGPPLPKVHGIPEGRVDIDWVPGTGAWGDTQNAIDWYARDQVREWFEFAKEFETPKARPWYVAAHLRHGAYCDRPDFYTIVGKAAVERAIVERGYSLDDVVWVSEETAQPHDDPSISYLPDFLTLMRADVLFRGNSGFSWWAGTLGDHEAVFSPDTGELTGFQDDVAYVEGNAAKSYLQGTPMAIREGVPA